MVTAELAPVTPGGELGESVAALSRALCQLGHAVTIALPRPVDMDRLGIMMARRLTPLSLANGSQVIVYDGQLSSGVAIVLFEGEGLQAAAAAAATDDEAQGASGAGASGGEVTSGVAIALSRAAAALAQQRASAGKAFDVVHAHGLAGMALPFSGLDAPTLLTVYDARAEGATSLEEMAAAGFQLEAAAKELLRSGEGYSLLKGGMLAADVVVTTSASYADTLRDAAQFGKLAEALTAGGREVYGVQGGIDYATQNPATDSALPTRFDAEAPLGKGACKSALLRELELELDPEFPLVCLAGRLDAENGADLVASLLPAILKLPLNLVVVGAGTKAELKAFASAKMKRATNFRFLETSTASDVRRTLAAADIALCPQRNVTTGHAIRVAQRFGALPVALRVPGSQDAIVSCDPELTTGTGFLAESSEPDALLAALEAALAATSKAGWGRLRRRVMRQDLGWERPARRYLQLYRIAATA